MLYQMIVLKNKICLGKKMVIFRCGCFVGHAALDVPRVWFYAGFIGGTRRGAFPTIHTLYII